MLGLAAQSLARQRRGVRDGNGFGTAKGADKLPIKGLAIRSITDGIDRHAHLLNLSRDTGPKQRTSHGH